MTNEQRFVATFHADNGKEWDEDELRYIPRVGDKVYPYERVKGVFEVIEVWEVGESNGYLVNGTHIFVKEIPMKGSRLYETSPSYYGN